MARRRLATIGPTMDHTEPIFPTPPPVLRHELVRLQMPVDVRSAAMLLLAALASLCVLRWAAPVFIPLMLGLLLTYALSPLIKRLQRWRIPRWTSAAVVLSGLALLLGLTAYSMAGSASDLVDKLPLAAQKLREALQPQRAPGVAVLHSVQQAAAQLEQVAQEGPVKPAPPKGVLRVAVERPSFSVRDYLWSGTMGLLGLLGQLTMVTFLAFFALSAGDGFRHKLVKISGERLSQKKITVQVLDEIRAQIERYLLVQLGVSALVGVISGLALWAMGMDNAVVWGVFAAVTNLIPYIGAIVMMGAAGMLAFLQFDSLQMGLLAAGILLLIHTLIGNLLLPWLTQRTGRLNPVAVLVALIFWGWMWGIWGLLLGVPMVMVAKSVCDRVDGLKWVGELLGD